MNDLRGLFAPVVSPFTDEGVNISEVRLARLMRHLAGLDIAGFVVNTTAGEFTTTSFGERKEILEIAIREAQGKPVIAHCSTLSTLATLDLAQHAARHGARAALVMPPYYGDFDDLELQKHFEPLALFGNLPTIIIDPLNRLSDAVVDALSVHQSLHFGSPIPDVHGEHFEYSTDCFSLEGLICLPVGTLRQHGELAELQHFLNQHGSERVLKAGLLQQDVEVGTPRAPRRPLRDEFLRELNHLLS